MRQTLAAAILAAMSCAAFSPAAQAQRSALMPMPVRISEGRGTLAVEGPLIARWSGCGDTAPLERAAERLRRDVQAQTGLIFDRSKPVTIAVTCRSPAGGVDHNEGYRLSVTGDRIDIAAEGPTGVLRGFATLRQLVGLAPQGIRLATTIIEDRPRFAWRGIMLDVARHFVAVPTILRQLDAMERLKLNVLHLHLSDNEAFRVESRHFPKLTAAAGEEVYSRADIRSIVAYAAERGIRVVPEFDVPGHSRAMVEAYPEIGVTAKGLLGMRDAALNPASPKTFAFLETLFAEMAELFPDRHFHVGGDEVPDAVWKDNPQIAAFMEREKLADKHAVEAWFHRRMHKILSALGKTMIGWEEVAAAGAPKDVVVQSWQTSNSTADTTAKGHRAIVSAGYYLDLLMPADYHYAINPASSSSAGLPPEHAKALRARSPLLAAFVKDSMVAFPRPALTAEQEQLILGGEAPLWGELVTDELVDHRLWPRAAAIAERFWSPSSVRDPDDMYRRLALIADLLNVVGGRERANRDAMMARIAPGESEPVRILLDAVGPVRNMAHDHRAKAALAGNQIVQPLNALADAAPIDSLTARRFVAGARDLLAGQGTVGASLRAQLTVWRDNHERFATIAAANPLLDPALPTSAQLAALAHSGLEALDAIEAKRPMASERVRAALELLDTLAAQEAASIRPIDPFFTPQPPADLIVKIGPGIRALVDAATSAMPR